MSHRSDFFVCSCRVNIQDPAVCFTVSLPSAVFQVALRRFLIPTAMSDSKSLNTSLLKVKNSSKMNVSLFGIWATLPYKSCLMLGGLQWMYARSGILLGKIQDMRLRGDSIYTAELRRQAILVTYVSFVIKFIAIHQNIGPAQWGNTCWQKLTSQSHTV